MAAHPHLSIGEVLSLLQNEFPDVTISKIRFLESQGLVDPERTPSGYRKFYDADIDRLRWVLRQQRDAFLPLKVIKGRLEEQGTYPPDEEMGEVTSARPGDAGAGSEVGSAVGGPLGGPVGGRVSGTAPDVTAGNWSADVEHLAPAPLGAATSPPTAAPGGRPTSAPVAAAQRAPAGGGARGPSAGPHGPGGTANGAYEDARAATGVRYAPAPGRRGEPAPGRRGEPAPGRRGEPAPESAFGEPGDQVGKTAQLFDVGPPYSAYGRAASTAPASHRGAVGGSRPARAPAPAETASAVRSRAPASPGVPAGTVGPGELRARPRTGTGGRGDRPTGATPGGGHPTGATPGGGRPLEVGTVPDEDELALEELVSAAGVDIGTVRDLERYGLITPRPVGGTMYYSHEAAVIAHLAGAFARHGVEARHLRAYKGAAEREAGMVQQVIMPLIRQRNPEARQAAAQAVEELSHLGGELRAALLRSALADLR